MNNQQLLRVAYDARMALGRHRGMGSVLRAAIGSPSAEFVGLCADGESDETLRLQARGLRFHPLWEQCSLPRRLRELRPDVFLAPYNTAPLRLPQGLRLVVVIHDLIYMEPLSRLALSRSMRQNLGRLYRRWNAPRAAALAERIVTVSEYSKQRIVDVLGAPPEKITVIHCSLDEDWHVARPASEDERGRYILSVSGEAPSKNLPAALQAYALARSRSRRPAEFPELRIGGVSAGAQAGALAQARTLGVGDAVRLLPYVDVRRMQELYRRAMFVFTPSLQEGFGIPLLEAMASGSAAVSSHATSLPEVGGDAPLYVDPTSVEAMAEGLTRMAEDASLRAACVAEGLRQSERFRLAAPRGFDALWRRMAETSASRAGDDAPGDDA